MKAVWSFWTKPFKAFGISSWTSERHHLYAWILSVETARKHFPRTALYTDDEGAELLVERVGLKFDEVSTSLSSLRWQNPEWWALGKIYTYSAQTEPFVHIDSDVFLWHPLSDRLVSAPVLGQNPERLDAGGAFYQPEVFEQVIKKVSRGWMPPEWEWYRRSATLQQGICCGVLGGNRVDFIRYYADLAIKLIEHPSNQTAWSMLSNKRGHNVLFEQYLLSACLEYHRSKSDSPFTGIEIQCLFDSFEEAFQTEQAASVGFTHLLGGSKKNEWLASRLEKRVREDYPEYYGRVRKQVWVF